MLAWGWNGRGTLGRGHRDGADASRPQQVQGLEGVRVVQVALGGWHCLALDDEGRVYAWGGNEYGQARPVAGKEGGCVCGGGRGGEEGRGGEGRVEDCGGRG